MSLEVPMPVKRLCKAIDTRAYVSEQEVKVEVTNKKAIDWKNKVAEDAKMLKRAYEEIDHFRSKCA